MMRPEWMKARIQGSMNHLRAGNPIEIVVFTAALRLICFDISLII
jgi:hypothetical protein